ncbi:hypothetical protein JTQ60_004001 [Salmonella enterica]|nr:hypothetical protein [Salmonella enterica]
MGSCAAPSAKGDDKFITTDYLQQCHAEYVISMQHDRSGLHPGLCGALQETPVKELICRQMEGGEKAFRSRYERILS